MTSWEQEPTLGVMPRQMTCPFLSVCSIRCFLSEHRSTEYSDGTPHPRHMVISYGTRRSYDTWSVRTLSSINREPLSLLDPHLSLLSGGSSALEQIAYCLSLT